MNSNTIHTQTLIQQLATEDADSLAFEQQHSFLNTLALDAEEAATLSHDVLAALRESPQHTTDITQLQTSPPFKKADFGAASIPLLVAVTFLLRTHIRFKRHPDGRWECLVEHKPGDSKLLTAVLTKIQQLLSKSGWFYFREDTAMMG